MTRRELGLVCAVAPLLAVVMTWPLVLHLGSQLPGDPANPPDPLLEAWAVAWGGHALIHQPAHFFDANAFWPLHDSLAFSDSLAGLAPAGLLGSSHHAAVLRYGLLFLLAYGLAFAGAYFLARELGASALGASFAGAAFAYAPFRLAHESHLHVLSSGGIPLAIALLLRGYRRAAPTAIVAGWLVALWQISLGWNLGLPLAYLLTLGTIGACAAWVRSGHPPPPRRAVAATLAGGLVALAGVIALALPYLHVVDRHPEARRTPDVLFFFSPSPKSLLAAPAGNLVWGGATSSLRLEPAGEKSLFVGAAALALAVAGLLAGRVSRNVRVGLGVAALCFALLALGFGFHGGRAGYRLLYDYAPGWQGLRTPGRLITFASLAVALLAAFGLDEVVRRAGRAGAAVAAVAVGIALLEGYGSIGSFTPPRAPAAFSSAPAPVLVLPATSDETNATAMFWSIGRFRPIANGWSGFHPRQFVALAEDVHGYPDGRSLRALRAYGVRSVLDTGSGKLRLIGRRS